jgi:AbrB family looped-hinge helix DNA binding protein
MGWRAGGLAGWRAGGLAGTGSLDVRISNFLTEIAMTELVRVKEKFQVTIPASLRKATALELGDYLEASRWGDGILLRPASAGKAAPRRKTGIMAFLNEHRAASRSRTDIDAQVQQDRDAWDQK